MRVTAHVLPEGRSSQEGQQRGSSEMWVSIIELMR